MTSTGPDGDDGREPERAAEAGPRPTGIRARGVSGKGVGGRSWFAVGFSLGLGATLAWLTVRTVLEVGSLLTLLLLAVFLALALEPVVVWLTRHRMGRGWAVAVVLVLLLALFAGFLALVVPPAADEINALVKAVPGWLRDLHDHNSTLGRFEDRYHLVEKAKQQFSSGGAAGLAGGLLGAGKFVVGAVTSAAIVIVVTVYVMAFLPALKGFCLHFVASRKRPHAQEVTEEILNRVGRYMLGNVATSVIAGAATFVWCAVTGVPYPAALGVFIALMDLIPIVGTTIGGVVVSLVALSVSLPVALATAGFYVGFRLAEDYLIVPRVMRFAVDVHPLVTVVGVLIGGALLGVVGALVAIPAAVAIGIVLDEHVFSRTDAS
ncbi:AI-2E family transporter [Streptomyces sp. ERV7]|uniref:AI-2E family transporter n=1 Tax=Streptomyces sp. ERV7 TaxID=1322334 RepID=UPI0007F518A3|nr:AI-2E family transporter [Streptomyces sp. ERV7]OAR22756.1 AI-2E family transporter [Streptomyces sp. ERV7]